MSKIHWFALWVLIFLLPSCSNRRPIPVSTVTHQDIMHFIPDSPVIIYKTRGDYGQYVPVRMNTERTEIVYFPDPAELHYLGKPAMPTKLNQGYWLDNYGIGTDVAFLRFNYKQYILLHSPPPVEIMMQFILDDRPLVEMYQCGYRYEYKDLIYELNVLIDRGLSNCRKIEIPEYPVDNENLNERK